jgi:hypothetical protein
MSHSSAVLHAISTAHFVSTVGPYKEKFSRVSTRNMDLSYFKMPYQYRHGEVEKPAKNNYKL